MLRCMRCGRYFDPGDNDQVCCDTCRDVASGFADLARMAAECEPLTLEEQRWQESQRALDEMTRDHFLD